MSWQAHRQTEEYQAMSFRQAIYLFRGKATALQCFSQQPLRISAKLPHAVWQKQLYFPNWCSENPKKTKFSEKPKTSDETTGNRMFGSIWSPIGSIRHAFRRRQIPLPMRRFLPWEREAGLRNDWNKPLINMQGLASLFRFYILTWWNLNLFTISIYLFIGGQRGISIHHVLRVVLGLIMMVLGQFSFHMNLPKNEAFKPSTFCVRCSVKPCLTSGSTFSRFKGCFYKGGQGQYLAQCALLLFSFSVPFILFDCWLSGDSNSPCDLHQPH